jgi:hypothetical protein
MKELPLNVIDPGTKSHPHRASAGPDCCSAGVSGPAMQHGGGSKLKGLMGRAPCPHADAAFRAIEEPKPSSAAAWKLPCVSGASPIG